MDHVVIVGTGHAGVQAAHSLRDKGYGGHITLIGDEPALPYQRPPLSKDFLASDELTPLPLRAGESFTQNRIDLRTGAAADAIDRRRQVVHLETGEQLHYSALVLATGATPRSLALPGGDLTGVHELRTVTDAVSLRRALEDTQSAVVVGAGFIGLEFAATARKHGVDVTVLEAGERAMSRAVSPPTATHIADQHRQMGTELRFGEGLAALLGRNGAVATAVGTSGCEYPADLVVMGVGVRPRDDLARAAGLPVDDGIVVDEHLRTADHAVHAIGDCANFPHALALGRLRLESVQNATDHGRHVASTIVGDPAPYNDLPWFWSSQGPLRLQIAGLAQPGDTTMTSGNAASGRFSTFCFRQGRLVAVESINRPADHMAARRVLVAGDLPTPEQVADPAFSLKNHALHLTPCTVTPLERSHDHHIRNCRSR